MAAPAAAPFTAKDRLAGYRYDLSILQAELSLTQVLDALVSGRIFFEQVIRESLDMGRPDQVQLIFSRRVGKTTPGRFRTRVLTHGVIPSLHVDYKRSRIKQYHKEGRAPRTETTINDPRDFQVGKRLVNLPALRQIGFRANRRLLSVQTISHDPMVGEQVVQSVVRPVKVSGQHAAGLRFDDPQTQALLNALLLFVFQPQGFAQRDLRQALSGLLAVAPGTLPSGRMTYDLRRLRLHGLIERIPKTHRYHLTAHGRNITILFSRLYARFLRPGAAQVVPPTPAGAPQLQRAFQRLDQQIQRLCDLAA